MKLQKTSTALVACFASVFSCEDREGRTQAKESVRSVDPITVEESDPWYAFDEDATTTPENMKKFIETGTVTVKNMYETVGRPVVMVDAGFKGPSFFYYCPPDTGFLVVVVDSNSDPFSDDLEVYFSGLTISSVWRLLDVSDLQRTELVWSRHPQEEQTSIESPLETDEPAIDPFAPNNTAEQGSTDQPATAPESKSEGNKNPEPVSEGRSQ